MTTIPLQNNSNYHVTISEIIKIHLLNRSLLHNKCACDLPTVIIGITLPSKHCTKDSSVI